MSPERTSDPTDLNKILLDMRREIRELQRVRLQLPEDSDALQTFEDASPLGDTRFLNFGAGINASLVGDDYVLVSASAGIGSPWDAVVDANAAGGTDEANRIFLGIGEALAFLNTLGLTRANVFVRPGTYTETVNCTVPASVLLFGAPGGNETLVTWNRGANLTMLGATSWHLEHIKVDLQQMTSNTTPFGTAVTRFFANNCLFIFRDTTSSASTLQLGSQASGTASFVYFNNCSFDGMRKLGAVVTMNNCDYRMRGDAALPAAQTGALFVWGMTFAGSSSASWLIPNTTVVHLMGASDVFRAGSQSPSFNLRLITDATALNAHIAVFSEGFSGPTGVDVDLHASGSYQSVALYGHFGSIFVRKTVIDGAIIMATTGEASGTSADITGPANIHLNVTDTSVILRGTRIVGTVSGNLCSGGRAKIEFVNADNCAIVATALSDGGATQQSYNFDAASANNVLLWHAHTSFAVAGVDNGTNNRVLPEAAPPAGGIAPSNADYLVGTANADLSAEIVVGTTPGGELGGTWAAPTVDALHSGSEHDDFTPRASIATYADRKDRTSGDITVNSTTWADLDNGLDIVLTAAAGDFVEVGLSSFWNNDAVSGYLNVVSVVSGSPVNTWSNDAAEGVASQGVSGWLGVTGIYEPVSGSVMKALQAGDIESGTVTLRLRYRTGAATNKILGAGTNQPLSFWARNHG